jgi:hypothetical protein
MEKNNVSDDGTDVEKLSGEAAKKLLLNIRIATGGDPNRAMLKSTKLGVAAGDMSKNISENTKDLQSLILKQSDETQDQINTLIQLMSDGANTTGKQLTSTMENIAKQIEKIKESAGTDGVELDKLLGLSTLGNATGTTEAGTTEVSPLTKKFNKFLGAGVDQSATSGLAEIAKNPLKMFFDESWIKRQGSGTSKTLTNKSGEITKTGIDVDEPKTDKLLRKILKVLKEIKDGAGGGGGLLGIPLPGGVGGLPRKGPGSATSTPKSQPRPLSPLKRQPAGAVNPKTGKKIGGQMIARADGGAATSTSSTQPRSSLRQTGKLLKFGARALTPAMVGMEAYRAGAGELAGERIETGGEAIAPTVDAFKKLHMPTGAMDALKQTPEALDLLFSIGTSVTNSGRYAGNKINQGTEAVTGSSLSNWLSKGASNLFESDAMKAHKASLTPGDGPTGTGGPDRLLDPSELRGYTESNPLEAETVSINTNAISISELPTASAVENSLAENSGISSVTNNITNVTNNTSKGGGNGGAIDVSVSIRNTESIIQKLLVKNAFAGAA